MAFPSTMLELITAKYHFLRPDKCATCDEMVAIHSTPGGREIAINLTRTPDSPAVRHILTCNTRTNPVEPPQAVDTPKTSLEPQQTQGGAEIDGIPMFGVTDPNRQLLSVGWRDGVLVCQFAKGKGSYSGVPEAEFMKLRKVPFAYRILTTNIKGKYPYTKLS
jgi:hypothetical protein